MFSLVAPLWDFFGKIGDGIEMREIPGNSALDAGRALG